MHDSIVLIEDHDQAYGIWKERGYKDTILVHIDAHPDIDWFNENVPADLLRADTLKDLDRRLNGVKVWNPSPGLNAGKPNIGNYICQAVREGILDKIYCVLPDAFLEGRARLSYWKRRVQNIVNEIPLNKSRVRIHDRCVCVEFLGRELIVCDMASLPEISSNVLLDIDTDFFVTDFDGQENVELIHFKKRLPWIWPDRLVEILKEKKIFWEVVTIAYSVQGYYTPLEFKYLGDYVGALLASDVVPVNKLKVFGYLRSGALDAYSGRFDAATQNYQAAIEFDPDYAASYYNLSLLLYKQGNITEAARAYQRAVNLDATYGTKYNNSGKLYSQLGLNSQARQEYSRMVSLGAEVSHVYCGLAEVSFDENKLEEARAYVDKALTLDPGNSEASYFSGAIMLAKGDKVQAVAVFERALALNPGQARVYARLAALYAGSGDFEKATTCYKRILRLGVCDCLLYLRIGILYFKRKRFNKVLAALWNVARLLLPWLFLVIKHDVWQYFMRRKIIRQVG